MVIKIKPKTPTKIKRKKPLIIRKKNKR